MPLSGSRSGTRDYRTREENERIFGARQGRKPSRRVPQPDTERTVSQTPTSASRRAPQAFSLRPASPPRQERAQPSSRVDEGLLRTTRPRSASEGPSRTQSQRQTSGQEPAPSSLPRYILRRSHSSGERQRSTRAPSAGYDRPQSSGQSQVKTTDAANPQARQRSSGYGRHAGPSAYGYPVSSRPASTPTPRPQVPALGRTPSQPHMREISSSRPAPGATYRPQAPTLQRTTSHRETREPPSSRPAPIPMYRPRVPVNGRTTNQRKTREPPSSYKGPPGSYWQPRQDIPPTASVPKVPRPQEFRHDRRESPGHPTEGHASNRQYPSREARSKSEESSHHQRAGPSRRHASPRRDQAKESFLRSLWDAGKTIVKAEVQKDLKKVIEAGKNDLKDHTKKVAVAAATAAYHNMWDGCRRD